jgi:hypothetical protein
MLNKKTAIAMAAVLLPLNANAANAYEFMGKNPSHFSYNYAEASFVDNDFDSGFLFGGSYDVTNSIAVVGSYLSAGDYTELKIGAAHHAKAGFLERADLVLHASYISAEYDMPQICQTFALPVGTICVDGHGGFDDSGITVGAALRHQLQDRIELFGDVSYSTLFDGDFLITGGAEWSFNDKLSVRGSYTLADIDTLSVGVRYYFK